MAGSKLDHHLTTVKELSKWSHTKTINPGLGIWNSSCRAKKVFYRDLPPLK